MTQENAGPQGEDADDAAVELELTDDDILDAMAHVPGYIDISTEDFRAIYHLAWQHAMERLRSRKGRR